MESRGKRKVKPPVPIYVPDEDVLDDDSEVESDFDIHDEDDEGMSISSEEDVAEGDDDLATSWRNLLEREGKASPDGSSLRDLILGPSAGA